MYLKLPCHIFQTSIAYPPTLLTYNATPPKRSYRLNILVKGHVYGIMAIQDIIFHIGMPLEEKLAFS